MEQMIEKLKSLPKPILIGVPLLVVLMLKIGLDQRDAANVIGRLVIVGGATGCGFAIGWFFSPSAKPLRKILLACLAGFAALIVILNDGMMGWSTATLLAYAGFMLGLSYWMGNVARGFAIPPTTFGSARWADLDYCQANHLLGTSGLRLGVFANENATVPLHYDGERHALTFAPTRGGKGVSAIIPNLLTYEGSVLVIDPKGENAMITGCDVSRFNPLDWLELGDVDITENDILLADALVVADGKGEAFWLEESKALLQGIILFVATDEDEQHHRHLGRVRDLLLLDGDGMKELFTRMLHAPHHVVASTGARCLQKEERLLANVVASAQAQTHFLDSARIRESLSASDVKFEDLKTKKMSIFLVLPSDRLNAFNRWLRLLVQQAITVNARNIELKPAKPVLFILDELPSLGKLSSVEQAYALMAGYGFQLWGIAQDLGQLKKVYGEDGYQSLISNSGCITYYGSRDKLSAEYFSALCGVTTVFNLSSAVSRAFGQTSSKDGLSSSSTSAHTDTTASAQRKLAYPDELMRLHGSKQIIFIENHHPIVDIKRPWFDDDVLKSLGRNLRCPSSEHLAQLAA
jgi:type IV secretion system protein VirD4